MMTFKQIEDLLFQYLEYLHDEFGLLLEVRLVLDVNGSYPKARDYAKTNSREIFLSPKILHASIPRVEGLLRHELGHVILMTDGDYDHSEREADEIAEFCFRAPIYYDEDGVQSTKEGIRPRPNHLPQ